MVATADIVDLTTAAAMKRPHAKAFLAAWRQLLACTTPQRSIYCTLSQPPRRVDCQRLPANAPNYAAAVPLAAVPPLGVVPEISLREHERGARQTTDQPMDQPTEQTNMQQQRQRQRQQHQQHQQEQEQEQQHHQHQHQHHQHHQQEQEQQQQRQQQREEEEERQQLREEELVVSRRRLAESERAAEGLATELGAVLYQNTLVGQKQATAAAAAAADATVQRCRELDEEAELRQRLGELCYEQALGRTATSPLSARAAEQLAVNTHLRGLLTDRLLQPQPLGYLHANSGPVPPMHATAPIEEAAVHPMATSCLPPVRSIAGAARAVGTATLGPAAVLWLAHDVVRARTTHQVRCIGPPICFLSCFFMVVFFMVWVMLLLVMLHWSTNLLQPNQTLSKTPPKPFDPLHTLVAIR